MKKISVFVVILTLLCLSANAQNTPLPYFNGFENPSDTAGWTFKKRPQGTGWAVGSATHCLGSKSIYISPDNGATATYGTYTSGYVSLAYKSFTLPAGTYQLTFDYQVGGDGTNQDMKVAWAPSSTTLSATVMGSSYPNQITQFQFYDDSNNTTFGITAWTHVSGTVTVPTGGGTYNLCFAFRCNSTTVSAPGACVDNIQLDTVKGNSDCTKVPANITVVKDPVIGVITTWSGNATQYEVIAANSSNPSDTTCCRHTGITTTSDTMLYSDLSEGHYFFYVRAICGSDTSIYGEKGDVIIYDVSAHCIDYATLNALGTQCTFGTYSNPYQSNAYIDNGPSQMSSRHTTHTDLNEMDPRTNNALHTVPNGEVMSVRLGNWNDGAEAEAISYIYSVPSGSAKVILLKYALVFEQPGHDEAQYTTVEVLDTNNVVLSATCASVNLACPTVLANGWHSCSYTGGTTATTVCWKEWDTLGINLTPYGGRKVRIRITNRDCNWAGHFGYTYFTIGCQDAELTAIPDATGDSTTLKAPDGFNYSWMNDCTDQFVSNSQSITIANTDSCNYTCACISKEQSSCSFSLTSNFTRYLFQSHTICQGDVYNWRGRSLTAEGVYYDSVMTGQRCDTLIELTLTVNPLYEITFVNFDGALLQRDTLCAGVIPQYTGATPTRDATAQYTYTFKGWSPALDTVTAAATYTAQYDSVAKTYNVVAMANYSNRGDVTGSGKYVYNETATLTASPNEGYIFTGWSNGETSQAIFVTVVSDTAFTAYFKADSAGSAVADVSDGLEIAVYPNPAHIGGTVYVEMSELVRMVEVYDADGKFVDRIEASGNKVEIKGLNATGIYLLRLTTRDGNVHLQKLIVK